MIEVIDTLARILGYGALVFIPLAIWVKQKEDAARRDLARMEHDGRIKQLQWAKENQPDAYPKLKREYDEWLEKLMQ